MNTIAMQKLNEMYYDKDEYKLYSAEEFKAEREKWGYDERYDEEWSLKDFLLYWLLDDIRTSNDMQTVAWAFEELDDIKSQLNTRYNISLVDFREWFLEILIEDQLERWKICNHEREVI